MIKTEAQLARTELELNAIDSAYSMMRYLQFNPKNDTWSRHLQALNDKIVDALERAEFWAANPN